MKTQFTYRLSRRSLFAGTAGAMLLSIGGVQSLSAISPSRNSTLKDVIADLIAANRILGHENVLDAYGHVSVRHPDRSSHFLMSQSRSPALVAENDIMEFGADGEPIDARGRQPYSERFIHAAILASRPDVHAVIHNHSPDLLPFSVSKVPLQPITHIGGVLGGPVPNWDIADRFGDETSLLVGNLEEGEDLASTLGSGPAALMRGHGAVVAGPSLRLAVYIALALHREASLLMAARELGDVHYISPGELQKLSGLLKSARPSSGVERGWQYWCDRAGVPYVPGR